MELYPHSPRESPIISSSSVYMKMEGARELEGGGGTEIDRQIQGERERERMIIRLLTEPSTFRTLVRTRDFPIPEAGPARDLRTSDLRTTLG